MYPDQATLLFSNMCPRKSRIEGIDSIVWFGLQYFIREYLIKQWTENFFNKPLMDVRRKYKRRVENTLGKGVIKFDHIEALHHLGYLPIKIMSLPEGSHIPIRVSPMVIFNTHPDFMWLVNYFETILSCTVWQPSTSATLSREFYREFKRAALETTGNYAGIGFQGHDFSMRGMSSLETACISGAGHLVFFDGTDTIPAIDFLEQYYYLDTDSEPVGKSVPATEHSVMCMGTKEAEIETFKRLLELFPTGFLSVVSDTWNLWTVLTDYLVQLKELILSREGRLVIRPDSGDPVDIICGTKIYYENGASHGKVSEIGQPSEKGVVELLWDVFGGTVNEQGYKVLDPHIGCIYGDSISIERAKEIHKRLKAKGFASTNWVAGVGSYTYQYNTRDTFGWAMKATYGELDTWEWNNNVQNTGWEPITPSDMDAVIAHGLKPDPEFRKVTEAREIWKDPVTDDGTKKSAKGLLAVYKDENGNYFMKDQVTWEETLNCEYKVVFEDGELKNPQSHAEIREVALERM